MHLWLGFLRRRFIWAVVAAVLIVTYSVVWGGPLVQALLYLTGLSAHPYGSVLGAGEWIGFVLGTAVVMLPAVLGFLLYLGAWIGWPGRPRWSRPRFWSGIAIALGLASGAFLVGNLAGVYTSPDRWRTRLAEVARQVSDNEQATWVGDMYFGLLTALVGLYALILVCAAVLPQDVRSPIEPGLAPESSDTTKIWWPYGAAVPVIVAALLIAAWPHLPLQ